MTGIPTWPPPRLDTWLAEVDALPPTRWLIDRLVPLDGDTLISGRAKLPRKTFAVMALVRVVATGRSMPGLTLLPELEGKGGSQVLFLEYEGPRVALAQQWRWLDNYAGWVANHHNVHWGHRLGLNLTDPAAAEAIVAYVQREGIKLAIVDTMARAAHADENDSQAMTALNNIFGRLVRAMQGGSVIYVHHHRKGHGQGGDEWEEDMDDALRGSTSISGAYCHHLGLRRGYARGSVHVESRSKLDEGRFWRWVWEVSEKQARAGFAAEELPLGPDLPADWLTCCYEAIDGSHVVTLRQLAEMWDVPRAVATDTVDALVGGGMLSRTARGFTKIGG